DKDYVAVSKHFKKIPVILTFDNPWRATFKQYIASIIGPLYLPKIFRNNCTPSGEVFNISPQIPFCPSIREAILIN
ncbi:MAG: hypothetical protein LH468_00350, partial [Nocardioides sp.]|nr:hypothetical protein [Nocardioides sp.]